MLSFLHCVVVNKRKTIVRRSYPLTIFLVSSSSLGQVPRSDPTSRDGDTARSACDVRVGRPFSSVTDRAENITGAAFNVDGGWEMH